MHRLFQYGVSYDAFLAMHRKFIAGIRERNTQIVNAWSHQ